MAMLPASLVVLGIVAALAPDGTAGGSLPPILGLNLIAYADLDGQVLIMTPDGTDARKISPDTGFYVWPTWSPDGAEVIFSGVTDRANQVDSLVMYSHRLDADEQKLVYVNEPGMGPILNGMPHYPLWSPDSELLSIMASIPRGLSLLLDERDHDGVVDILLTNAPLYTSWSFDSRYLMVHGGVNHFLVDTQSGTSFEYSGVQSASYRVPAWWPGGHRFAYVSENPSGGGTLFISDLNFRENVQLEELPGSAAFLWSPDGAFLALGRSPVLGGIVYQNVSLYTIDGTRHPFGIEDNVMAFFWSPDSSMLAYVTLTESRGALQWLTFNVSTGERRLLAEFIPSDDQLTLLQFFDQFAYSHSMWSPDSKSLVFAGYLTDEAVAASTSQQRETEIFVVDVRGYYPPVPIAKGVLAVWSPK